MLALTERAAEAINALTAQPGLPDEAALRISSVAEQSQPGEMAGLEVSLVEGADETERAIQDPPVYVEPGPASDFLDDKVLDAEIDSGQITFRIAQQPGPTPPGIDGRPTAEG